MRNTLNKRQLPLMRFQMTIAYDGTDFLGWQSQPGGQTVQDVIEAALQKVFKRHIRIHGASRTDSGVHAWGQVCHFDANWKHTSAKLRLALQALLPETVFIRSLSTTSDRFHARFGAQGKRYIYKIKLTPAHPFEVRNLWEFDYPIDFKILKKALGQFVGKHNFTSFAGNVKDEETPVKTISKITAVKRGVYITVTLIGSGFLYKMVRSLVGTAMEVARGKLASTRIKALLNTPKRTHEVVTAPAKGLILDKVFYPVAHKAKKR